MISSFMLQNCEKSTAIFYAAQSVRGRDSTGDLHSAVQTRAECPAPSPSPAAEHTQVHDQLLPDGFKLRSTVTLDDQTNTKTSTLFAKWTGLGREGRQLRERPLQMSVREESYRGFEQQ